MNDFSELEADLKALRPAAPSAELTARVERTLAIHVIPSAVEGSRGESSKVIPRDPSASLGMTDMDIAPQSKRHVNWAAIGFGLAAAAAVVLLARVSIEKAPVKQQSVVAITPQSTAPAMQNAGLVPDGLTRVVYNTRNEGLLFPHKIDQPVRRVRSHSRETLQWRDPANGASLRVSYPTEEVDLIPVSGQ